MIDCLGSKDLSMKASCLQWVNNMIRLVDDEAKQAEFLNRLETQGFINELTLIDRDSKYER
jgi:hypothetical protein